MNRVVVKTEHLADVIEEFGLLTSRRVRHIRSRHGALRSLVIGIRQNCPKIPPISYYQGKMASESYGSVTGWLGVTRWAKQPL